ncbi:MAG: hypothetical protein M0001_14070 [Treponema sp.]|nr:hypothetical protein [Treponema sp.]
MRFLRSGFVHGLALLALAACSAREVSSFTWIDPRGAQLGFSRPGSVEGEEGLIEGGAPSAQFRLSHPFAAAEAGALSLELALTAPARVSLGFLDADGAKRTDYELFAPDPSMTLVFPLEGHASIDGIELGIQPLASGNEGGTKAEGAPKPIATLKGLAFVAAFHGLAKGPGMTTLSPGFSLLRSEGRLVARIERPFADVVPLGEGLPALRLGWRPGSAKGTIELVVPGLKAHHVAIRPGADGILIPEGWFGPAKDPAYVEFVAPAGLDIVECATRAYPREAMDTLDLGVVLNLPPPSPAVPFEVYRWDALPKVLVFDFADYAAQDAALKRLAFFVEKAGYRGRLAPDKEIAALHGWNAHDYRASDLAAFFEKARRTSFQLGESELTIRGLLLSAGIIRATDSGYVAGEGAMISISRESPSWLRATFMAHEASHAIYFTDPDFNAFVRKEWAAIGKDERWFWKLYFGWMNYDTADEDLMATEFMAYLYQQPVSHVDQYFTKILPSRLLENHPDLKPRIDAWMARFGPTFKVHAEAIEAWLKERYGFVAARPWSLY